MADLFSSESIEVDGADNLLLPDKHPNAPLFICDMFAGALKDFIDFMEYPFFALSKKPDTRVRKYERGGKYVKVTPSSLGMPTIYDKDILIFAVSQLIRAKNAGLPISNRIRIGGRELLMFCNRGTGGREYELLVQQLERLKGAVITTNVIPPEEQDEDDFPAEQGSLIEGDKVVKPEREGTYVFGFIASGKVIREKGEQGRLISIDLELPKWMMRAVENNEVLTLNRDYFRLRKPLERRVYEILRKHVGRQAEWRVSIDTLYQKSGSLSPINHFRYMIKEILENNHLPDYVLEADDKEIIRVMNRNTIPALEDTGDAELPSLKKKTYTEAKEILPAYDIAAIESEWRYFWEKSGRPAVAHPDAAFLGFCRKKANTVPDF